MWHIMVIKKSKNKQTLLKPYDKSGHTKPTSVFFFQEKNSSSLIFIMNQRSLIHNYDTKYHIHLSSKHQNTREKREP